MEGSGRGLIYGIKVNWSRYTPWRLLGWEEVQFLLILNLGIRWGWVVSITPRPRFTLWERTPGTHCTGAGWAPEPVWTQRLGEKNPLPLSGIEPRSSSPEWDTILTELPRLLNLWYYPSICLEGLTKTTKLSARIAGLWLEIWTLDLQNGKQVVWLLQAPRPSV
jgi:hypothetical protein